MRSFLGNFYWYGLVCCISVYIWYQWADHMSEATPEADQGEVSLPIEERCEVVEVALGVLDTTTREIIYRPSKSVWLPALVTSVSALSSLAVLSTSLDCGLQEMELSVCPLNQPESCEVSRPSSYTETYIRSAQGREGESSWLQYNNIVWISLLH